jgi:signal peptidase I
MDKSLAIGDYIVVETISGQLPSVVPVRHGQIVVYRPLDQVMKKPDDLYVKRVIGLPGDHVKIERGQLFLNGRETSEPYVLHTNNPLNDFWPRQSMIAVEDITVPSDTVFLLGDNRDNSDDSRIWGPLPLENIVGVVVMGWRHWQIFRPS